MPRSSPAEPRSILIAAISGRALAASARRAGLVPLVADFFADADTLRLAHACAKLPGDIRRGFRWVDLEPALETLSARAPSPPLGLVYGAGFEDRISLLAKIGERFPLIGNDAQTVQRVKAPDLFFGTLAGLGIPHPRTLSSPPSGEPSWLAKRKGGAGGSHVRKLAAEGCGKSHSGRAEIVADRTEKAENRLYFQELIQGRPVSALFVANGREACVLGFSEQWASPKRGAKWRYGGAVQPAAISRELAARLAADVQSLAPAFGLRGLGSADFLVDDEKARLLEVNPRPGATLDIFDSDAQPLLHLHIQAVLQGMLPMGPLPPGEATAATIVYAPAPVQVEPGMVWPDWTSDQPKRGERISKDRPICTVLARAATGRRAKRLVEERRDMILKACAKRDGGSR